MFLWAKFVPYEIKLFFCRINEIVSYGSIEIIIDLVDDYSLCHTEWRLTRKSISSSDRNEKSIAAKWHFVMCADLCGHLVSIASLRLTNQKDVHSYRALLACSYCAF